MKSMVRFLAASAAMLTFTAAGVHPLLAQNKAAPVEEERAVPFPESDDLLDEKGAVFELRGHYKNLFMFQRVREFYGQDLVPSGGKNLLTDLNRLRLSPEFRYADSLVLHADYDNEIIFSNYSKSYEFDRYWRPSGYNELINMNWDLVRNRDLYYRMKINRLFAKVIAGDMTLTLGRQQIRFGSGRLWNPLDILNPISPTYIEGPEEQKGTDAVRLDYFFNPTTELSLVYDPKRYDDDITRLSPRNANSVARFKTSAGDFEIAALAGYIARRVVGGADVSVILFEGLLRGSVLYSHPEKGRAFIQAGGGYEYTFGNGIYFLCEYFYNQNGLNYNSQFKYAYYDSAIYGVGRRNYFLVANQFVTYNQHYAGLALGYDFHPLVRGDFFCIYDFQGKGLFWTVSVKYNVIENMDLQAGVMMAHVFGNRDTSDFGALQRQYIYSLSLAYYF